MMNKKMYDLSYSDLVDVFYGATNYKCGNMDAFSLLPVACQQMAVEFVNEGNDIRALETLVEMKAHEDIPNDNLMLDFIDKHEILDSAPVKPADVIRKPPTIAAYRADDKYLQIRNSLFRRWEKHYGVLLIPDFHSPDEKESQLLERIEMYEKLRSVLYIAISNKALIAVPRTTPVQNAEKAEDLVSINPGRPDPSSH